MNKILKSALIEMKAEGVLLDPIDDLAHILTLDRLSRRMTDMQVTGEAGVFWPAVTVGNVTLHRLSLGAQCWLFDTVAEWYANNRSGQDMAYLFAMAHADRPELLWAVQDSRAALDKAIRAWKRTVNVPLQDLMDAARRLQDAGQAADGSRQGPVSLRGALAVLERWRPLPEAYRLAAELAIADADEESGYGHIIDRLCLEYGGTPIDWVWRRSSDELWMLLETRQDRVDAAASESKTAANSRFMRAHREFCAYKDRLIRLKKGAK